MNRFIRYCYLICTVFLLSQCTVKEPVADKSLERYPEIFPDYIDITLPANIAPPRFQLEEEAEEAVVVIGQGEEQLVVKAKRRQFLIPEKRWKTLARSAQGALNVQVYARLNGKWTAYRPFAWHIATEEVDPYLVYRLIEPGYELWNRMGIYQRNLSNYEQEPIVTNDKTEGNCMNCHSFNRQSPDTMLFHMRAKLGGTYLAGAKGCEKLNTDVSKQVQSLVYPSWHPSGRFVAFSVNQTRQGFHKNDRNRIEVFDLASDVVVYDVARHEVLRAPQLSASTAFETFPTFSADGKRLYFCTAASREMPAEFDQVKYNLCSIAFDPEARTFGTEVDTLYHSLTEGGSVSFPRVSPDGRFLAYTTAAYGNFSIWHKEADLYLLNLSNRQALPMKDANSNEVESYHSWSSNSRWMVFSSRRTDGLYTHPHLVYIDENGTCSKAFAVPQADPAFYKKFMYSFNIPELLKGKVKIDTRELLKKTREEGMKVKMAEAVR